MSTQVYSSFVVFTAKIPADAPALTPTDLIGDPDKAIIVMSKSHCSNDFPICPVWRIEYIGTESELATCYAPAMEEMFADGIARFEYKKGSKSFAEYLGRLVSSSHKLTLTSLYARGYDAYSLSEEDYNKVSQRERFVPFKQYNEMRYAHPLESEEDLSNFIRQAFEIKAVHSKPLIHFGPIWKLDRTSFAKHKTNQETALA